MNWQHTGKISWKYTLPEWKYRKKFWGGGYFFWLTLYFWQHLAK